MKDNKTSATGGGIFLSLLAVAFVVLKLTGFIDWSWLWVLAPLWIPTAIAIVIILIVLVVAVVKVTAQQVEENQRADAAAASVDADAAKYGLERQPGESNVELKRRIAYFKQAERRARHDR